MNTQTFTDVAVESSAPVRRDTRCDSAAATNRRGRIGSWATALCGTMLVLLLAAGCSSWKLDTTSLEMPWEKNRIAEPTRVVAVWSDTVMHRSNTVPHRGFGGRLMFYDNQGEKSVKVDGTLVVYAFDEDNRAVDNPVPDRKYVFTPEQLKKYYSKSQVGGSYSVWLPWDEADGLEKQISLIVRFTPVKGSAVTGEQQLLTLPGRLPPSRVASAEKKTEVLPGTAQASANAAAPAAANGAGATALPPGTVQRVSYETSSFSPGERPAQADPAAAPPKPAMQVTTIDVPGRMSASLLAPRSLPASGPVNPFTGYVSGPPVVVNAGAMMAAAQPPQAAATGAANALAATTMSTPNASTPNAGTALGQRPPNFVAPPRFTAPQATPNQQMLKAYSGWSLPSTPPTSSLPQR